jgi:glutamine synthetase
VNVRAEAQAANLPGEVRAALDAFCNGSLPAGQLYDALARAWARSREPEQQRFARSHLPLPTEQYATAN